MRTLQSEAKRLIRQYGAGEPTVATLGDALVWLLFSSGELTKRRRRGHGKAWRSLVFRGGSYGPNTR